MAIGRDSPPDLRELRRLRGARPSSRPVPVLQEMLLGCRGARAGQSVTELFAGIATIVPTRNGHIGAADRRDAWPRIPIGSLKGPQPDTRALSQSWLPPSAPARRNHGLGPAEARIERSSLGPLALLNLRRQTLSNFNASRCSSDSPTAEVSDTGNSRSRRVSALRMSRLRRQVLPPGNRGAEARQRYRSGQWAMIGIVATVMSQTMFRLPFAPSPPSMLIVSCSVISLASLTLIWARPRSSASS